MSRLIPRERWGETTVAIMSETGQPTTECPVCRYNLTGLPKNHRCPECGFEYDETMVVWKTRLSGWTAWGLPAFVILVWSNSMWRQLGRYLSNRGNPDWFHIGTGLLLPATVVFWVLAVRRGGIVVFGKEGFSYRFPFGRLRMFRWDEVTISRAGRLPRRRARRWLTTVPLPTGVMSEPDLQRLLFEMYNRWLRSHETRVTQARPRA